MKGIEKVDEKDSQEFLRYVYRVFFSKNKEYKLESGLKKKGFYVEYDKLKKILQKVVVYYYFDKVDIEKYGKVWKVLFEEIIKRLIRRYERMKQEGLLFWICVYVDFYDRQKDNCLVVF